MTPAIPIRLLAPAFERRRTHSLHVVAAAPVTRSVRTTSQVLRRCLVVYLITGGAGFIGSHLTDRLAARGDRIVVLDDLSCGVPDISNARSTWVTYVSFGAVVLDAELVQRCISEVDVCVHFAAALGVKRIVDRPLESLLANVRGADVVMAAANEAGCRLMFASSSEVYGKRSGDALTELADCTIGAPSYARWSYAIAKQFGEALANAYRQDAEAAITTVRLFNIVGPRQSSAYGMVLPQFVAQALADRPITIYGDGSQSRCFTSVHDAIDALELLLTSDEAVAGRSTWARRCRFGSTTSPGW